MDVGLLSYAFVLVVLIPAIISTVAIVRYGRAVRTRAAIRWAIVSVVAFVLSVSVGLAQTFIITLLDNPDRYQQVSAWLTEASGVLSFVVSLAAALAMTKVLREASSHYEQCVSGQEPLAARSEPT